MKIILFSGFSNSGKTTTIEGLCRILVAKRFKVGVLKSTHSPSFTIDTPGKDTWRFARAGAKVIVSLSDFEVAIIKKRNTSRVSLERIIDPFRKNGIDYLMVEGLHRRFGRGRRKRNLIRVLCAKNKGEAARLLKYHRHDMRPICITGKLLAEKGHQYEIQGIPIIQDIKKIAKIITDQD